MSNMLNYCSIDFKSPTMCNDSNNNISKYSEDVNSINDVISCNKNNSSNLNSPSVFEWKCTDRASCNMGDGSYQKWQTYLRRS